MTRRRGALIFLTLVGLLFLVVPVPRAGAATVQAAGWWYRPITTNPAAESPQALPAPPPTLPATPPGPPTVSASQLHVEGVAAGATAIAAVTFAMAPGETSPVLTIFPDPTSVIPPEAVILACKAAVEWTEPETLPGRWEDKTLVDCSRSVQAQPGEGGTLVFPLQPLQSGRLVDIVIVPGTIATVPAPANGSAFSLTFNRPESSQLQTTFGPVEDEEEFEEALPDFDPGSSTEPEYALGFDPSGTLLTDPILQPPVAPALEPQDQAPAVPRLPPPLATTLVDVGDIRLVGMLILVACAMAAYVTANQAPRTTIGLGRFRRPVPAGFVPGAADDEVGPPEEHGLGRLRRPRTGPAPSL